MSFDFTAAANHAASASAPVTGAPGAFGLAFNTTIAQSRHFMSLVKTGSETDALELMLDISGPTGRLAARTAATSGGTGQTLTNVIAQNVWQHGIVNLLSNNLRRIVLNGLTVGPGSGVVIPAGINTVTLNGRQTDFAANAGGPMAHAFLYGRGLTPTEEAYLGSFGNPRALQGLVGYWKLNRTVVVAGVTQIPDEVGNTPLIVTGTMAAGASDPPLASFMTGGRIGNLVYPVGAAIPSIDVGSRFDNVSSAFAVTLRRLGIATPVSICNTALAAARETTVDTVGAFAAGDYAQFGIGGQPTLVLAVTASTATLLVAKDQTVPAGTQIYRLPVTGLSIPGVSITSNVLGGSFTGPGSFANCFFRATCNANPALFADSDLINISGVNALPVIFARPPRRRRRFVTVYTRR